MNEGRIEQAGSPEEVYNHPANPFVYKFLGNVNLFHGRTENGKTYIQDAATGNMVYVRSHRLEITRESGIADSFRAKTKHIHSVGPLVKLEMVTDWGAAVQVEMSQERFQALRLAKDEKVFLIARDLLLFPKPQNS